MSKDAYWFKHDSTAGRGLRMRKMAHIYGHWGKGVYWDVIEVLRDQAGYSFDCDTPSLQMLADLIGCKDEPKFIGWMRDCVQIDLFQQVDGRFYSAILSENMQEWEKQKRNGSQPKAKPKPNGSIRGEEKRVENRIEDETKSPTDSLVLNLIQFEKEIRNSNSKLEAAARRNKVTVEKITAMIPDFIDTCKLKDKTQDTYKEYCNYFSNWLLTEFSKEAGGKFKTPAIDTVYKKPEKPKSIPAWERIPVVTEDQKKEFYKNLKPEPEKPSMGLGDRLKDQFKKI